MEKPKAAASATSVGKRRAKFEDYDGFVAKFAKPAKMTTDECYTPPEIYEAVRDWACAEYGIDAEKIVRPFYPGGDYERFDYSGGKVVVDNPPFSRLAEIVRFYLGLKIPFFLFANGLTALSSRASFGRACRIITDTDIVYANGAKVNTSFITSFEPGVVARTAPELTRLLAAKVAELRGSASRTPRRYEFPREVLRATDFMNLARRGVDFRVLADECVGTWKLDGLSRRNNGGGGIRLLPACFRARGGRIRRRDVRRARGKLRGRDSAGTERAGTRDRRFARAREKLTRAFACVPAAPRA